MLLLSPATRTTERLPVVMTASVGTTRRDTAFRASNRTRMSMPGVRLPSRLSNSSRAWTVRVAALTHGKISRICPVYFLSELPEKVASTPNPDRAELASGSGTSATSHTLFGRAAGAGGGRGGAGAPAGAAGAGAGPL